MDPTLHQSSPLLPVLPGPPGGAFGGASPNLSWGTISAGRTRFFWAWGFWFRVLGCEALGFWGSRVFTGRGFRVFGVLGLI